MSPKAEKAASNGKHLFSRYYKSIWMVLLYSIILATILHFLSLWSLVREIEKKTIDMRFLLSPLPEEADRDIVLIAIDQGSLEYTRELGQGWPLPRSFYGLITSYLNKQHPKAIVFDMLFDERDFYRGDADPEASDEAFATAMAESGRTVLGMSFATYKTDLHPGLTRHALSHGSENDGLSQYLGADTPIPMFIESTGAVGGFSLSEGVDATLRSIPLYYGLQGYKYPNLGIAAYRLAHPESQIQIPKTPEGEFYLRWYGQGGHKGVFDYLPFSDLLYSAVQEMQGNQGSLDPEYFANKYVIIGATASGLMDLKTSPYTWAMPGMETWATFLSNVEKGHYLRFPAKGIHLLGIFLIVLLVFLAVLRLGSGASFFVVITLFVLLCFGSWLLFAKAFYIVDLSSLILGLIVAWLAGLTLSYTMEGKNKRELRMIFSKYLHPDLVDRIVENPYLVTMGGEELSVTVMFSDIYNFTGFSEKHNPQELVSYLNEYFATFTNSILDHNGLLDKYTGDGLMAVFGAPIARTDHALSACLAALSHRKMAMQAADKKNLSPAEFFHLNTRLGINTGSVVAGNIGSSRRMEYTSIGDAVNLAARLEGVNKVFQTHIIVAESTWNEVHEVILCRELDTLRVKGKEQGTRIFELIGEIKELDLAEYGWTEDYVSALNLYRKGEFSDAALRFKELFPDPPAQTMYNRCQRLLQYPPENWDGIYTLEEK